MPSLDLSLSSSSALMCAIRNGHYFARRRCNATFTALGVRPRRSAISTFEKPAPANSFILSGCDSPFTTSNANRRPSRSSCRDSGALDPGTGLLLSLATTSALLLREAKQLGQRGRRCAEKRGGIFAGQAKCNQE